MASSSLSSTTTKNCFDRKNGVYIILQIIFVVFYGDFYSSFSMYSRKKFIPCDFCYVCEFVHVMVKSDEEVKEKKRKINTFELKIEITVERGREGQKVKNENEKY